MRLFFLVPGLEDEQGFINRFPETRGISSGILVDWLPLCTPNVFIQEQSLGIHYNQGNDLLDYLLDPAIFKFQHGFIHLPKGPGLGIEVNEEKVREAARTGHSWKPPVWQNEDGTVAEW